MASSRNVKKLKEPSKSQCEDWTNGLGKTLEDEEGFEYFSQFLERYESESDKRKGEYTVYLDFWKSCEEIKDPTLGFKETKSLALQIIDTYLVAGCQKRILLAGTSKLTNEEQRSNIENISEEKSPEIRVVILNFQTR